MPQEETYFEQAIRETEESIRDAERELERLRRQLDWLIAHRPKPDEAALEPHAARKGSGDRRSP